jgi:hypothetical protein
MPDLPFRPAAGTGTLRGPQFSGQHAAAVFTLGRVTSPLATVTRPDGAAAATADSVRRADRRRRWRLLGSAIGGTGTALVVYTVLAHAVVEGPLALTVLGLLVMAVPTSPELARRIVLNVSLLVGWAQVLWWWRWPFAVDHAAVVLAVAAGALVTWVVGGRQPRRRLAALVPRPRVVDLLVPFGGILALVTMWRWAFPASARRALVALLPGADNYAHFHMFSTIREYGAVTISAGPAPDGAPWGFDEYPQGFHALAATLSELMRPHLSVGPQLLTAYTQAVATVIVLGVVAVTAAIVSLPGLRDRVGIAVPVVVVSWTAFLWEPGQNLLADGFANFWLAAVAAGCALLLGLAPQRRLAFPEIAAIGGLLVAVAHAWAPLIVLAGPAVFVVLHPLPEAFSGRAYRQRLVVGLGVLLVAAAGVLKALVGLFADVHVEDLVTSWGGIHGSNPAPVFLLMVTGIYLCLASSALVRRRGGPEDAVAVAGRARVLVLTPVAGLLLGTVLFVAQLRTIGTSSYYFLKFFMGYELVLAVLVPALAGVALAGVGSRVPRRLPAVLVTVLVTVLASQAFGRFPRQPAPLFDSGREGTAMMRAPFSPSRIADGIIAAAAGTTSRQGTYRDYLAVGRDRAAQPFYPDGWYHGVLASLSTRVQLRIDLQRHSVHGIAEAVPVARRLMRTDRRVVVVVDPRVLGPLRNGLGEPGLAARVVPWPGAGR